MPLELAEQPPIADAQQIELFDSARALGLTTELLALQVRSAFYGFEAEKVQRGEFELSMGWADDGPTPYRVFRGVMATETVKPFGENTYVNWHRFGNDEADALLTRDGPQ